MGKKKTKSDIILDSLSGLADHVAALDQKFTDTVTKDGEGLVAKVSAIDTALRMGIGEQRRINQEIKTQLKNHDGRLRILEVMSAKMATKLGLILGAFISLLEFFFRYILPKFF